MAAFCLIPVKAVPNAPRSEVAGRLGEAIKIKLKAPPVEGRANDALLEFLAGKLGVPKRSVSLERGGTSRHKLVRVDGLNLAEAYQKLGIAAWD